MFNGVEVKNEWLPESWRKESEKELSRQNGKYFVYKEKKK